MNTGFKIENLTITYHGNDSVDAVRNVSFATQGGSCTALIGETGSGKTTIAKAMARILPDQAQLHEDSRIWYTNQEIISMPKNKLSAYRRNVRYIFQHPLECFNPSVRLGKQFSDIIKLYEKVPKLKHREIIEKVFEKVHLFEFDRILSALPHELSQGQLQRVNMAMALIGKPDVILADEPLASVDAVNRYEIVTIFNEMKKSSNMELIIISHDLQLVEAIADKWLVFKDGMLSDQGIGSILQSKSPNRSTHELITAYQDLLVSGKVKKTSAIPIFRIENLTYKYQNDQKLWKWKKQEFEVLRDINVVIYEQDSLGLIGESGSGKSTLAMIMGGLLYPGSRKLFMNSKEIPKELYASKLYYKNIQYILQEAESSLAPKRRIGKMLTDVIAAFRKEESAPEQKVKDMLSDLGLDASYFNRFSHELSGGEKQRVAFARALLVQPKILILDESFSGLDRKTLHENLQVLTSLKNKYLFSIILISHDINLVGHYCTRVVVLKDGRIVEEGMKESILKNPAHSYTKKLIEAGQLSS